jgi:hypothetical protein
MTEPSAVAEEVELATAELLGALAYGQLRAFTAAVAIVPLAPDLERSEVMLAFADRERERYRTMRGRLEELTDLPRSVMQRQKSAFDRFFDDLAIHDWVSGVAFLAVGLPLSADFARAVAPAVDDVTADVIIAALAGRNRTEEFAREQLLALMDDEEHHERARQLVARVIGVALTEFTSALGSTDALRVLFERHAAEEGVTSEQVVKRLAMDVLEEHRRRMHALGLDDLE